MYRGPSVHRVYTRLLVAPLSFRVGQSHREKWIARESFPIKMDYEEEPIENRNCNFITRGGGGVGGEKGEIFSKGK